MAIQLRDFDYDDENFDDESETELLLNGGREIDFSNNRNRRRNKLKLGSFFRSLCRYVIVFCVFYIK